MRNVELKALLRDPAHAVEISGKLGATHEGVIHQIDTYYTVPNGRLKYRQCDPGEDYLVFYLRLDSADATASEYVTEFITPTMRSILEAALGRLAIVEKKRDLWLWENVRIHLDQVKGLGNFIEFEAVLSEKYDEADGYAKVATLQEAFGIKEMDLCEESYIDMVLESPTR